MFPELALFLLRKAINMRKPIIKDYLKATDVSITPDFGRLVAEQDKDLADYYVAPERYVARAVNIDDPATFFVGPKGIGKSAILQMVRLTRESEENRIISIAPDDLAFSALANIDASTPLMKDASNNQWLFKSLWDYVLSLEVLRKEFQEHSAYENYLKRIFKSESKKKAESLLKISLSDDGSLQSLSSKILQLVREVELSAGYDKTKLSGKVSIDGKDVGKGDQLNLLGLVNSVAKNLPATLKHPYYILVDDLDLHWSNTPIQNSFIAALFLSLRSLSKPPIKCVVAMRDHIYKSLPLKDRDKFHDWVCEMEWDFLTVKHMITKRVQKKLKCGAAEIWGGAFPASAFDKMWHHTFGRPRELVRLASLCFQEGRRQGHTAMDEADVASAIRRFSDERISDLASEVQHDYPSFDLLVRKFAGWPKEFSLNDFNVKFAEYIDIEVKLQEGHSSRYSWTRGYTQNPRNLATIFLETGFFMIKSNRNTPPRRYDINNPQDITDDTWLAIHPTYWYGLNLIGSSDF